MPKTFVTEIVVIGLAIAATACTARGSGNAGSPFVPRSPSAAAGSQRMTVEDAMVAIGATCTSERATIADCRWKGITFLLATPKTWQEGKRSRIAFCGDGVVDRWATMVTDGRTWWIAAKQMADVIRLERAVVKAGLRAHIDPYCPGVGGGGAGIGAGST